MDEKKALTDSAAPEVKLNRKQRRDIKHKRGIASPTWGSGRVVSTAAIDKATACRPFTEKETATAHALTALAWQALQSGIGTEDDFDRVAKVINLSKIRALEIDQGLANELENACAAMTSCKARYAKNGRFGFTGPELLVMRDAMAYQIEIVNASSAEQMRRAYRVMRATLHKQMQEHVKQGLALQIMTAAGDAGSTQWELGGFAQLERSRNEDLALDAALEAQDLDKAKRAEAMDAARNGGCGCCGNACADRTDGCRFIHESPSAADIAIAAQAKQGGA